MNEMDLKTKIEGLKKAIAEHSDFTNNYKSDLAKAEQQLKDLGKIALPPMVFDEIYEAVDNAICEYDFNDSGNYNIEYGIEYDGRVYAESIELQHNSDLIEAIVAKVSRIFTEEDCPEDTPEKVKYDDKLNNATHIEKVI